MHKEKELACNKLRRLKERCNSQDEDLNLCIAVTESDGEGLDMPTFAKRVAASIKNDGLCIYNGNNEVIGVPFLCKIRTLHPNFIGRESEFGGWMGCTHIKMIDFDKCGADQRDELLVQNSFNPDTITVWLLNRQMFDDNTTVAIHIEDSEGDWYEYIINSSVPALDD